MSPKLLLVIRLMSPHRVRHNIHNLKPFPHLCLGKERRSFESLVGILFINGAVMFPRVFTAFHHEQNKAVELGVGVVGVVGVCG